MIRTILAATAFAALTACAPAQNEPETSEFGVDVDAMGACVKANASPAEMDALSAGGSTATDATAAILARPATLTCLDERGVDLSAFS